MSMRLRCYLRPGVFLSLLMLTVLSIGPHVNAHGPHAHQTQAPPDQAPPSPVTHAQSDRYWAIVAQNAPAFQVNMSALRIASPSERHQYGAWGPVMSWPYIPVSAANLPDGRILAWASNQRDAFPAGPEYTYAGVWDPRTGQHQEIPHTQHDMFCAHNAVLEDGRVFVTGGRNTVTTTSMFDYRTNTWVLDAPMARGRWYPTTIALPNGQVLTALGSGGANTPEIWTPGKGWRDLSGINLHPLLLPSGFERRWWPYLHITPQGNLFHAGPTNRMNRLNYTGRGSLQALGERLAGDWYPKHASPVVYDTGKVLISGGAAVPTGASNDSGTSTQAVTIDFNGASPQVTSIAPMAYARRFHNAVVLPTGAVLVIGGNTSGIKFSDEGTVLAPEIWYPETGTWHEMADMAVPRNYHSIALLLPDGRVLSAGGGLCGSCTANHQDGQVFSPPYLFNADGSDASRPAISLAPDTLWHGQAFTVHASAGIQKFSLIKMSSTTHGLNTDLRYLSVPFTAVATGQYRLTTHANPNVLTPGYYMLFAVDAQGVPSEAKVLQVGAAQQLNVALGKPASQSSTEAGASPERANDGNTNGRFDEGSVSHTQSEFNAWWEVDLGAIYNLSAIRLWNRADCCGNRLKDFHVLVSDTPFVSQDLSATLSQPGVSNVHFPQTAGAQTEINLNRTGRFVRIQLAGQNYLHLAEVEILEAVPVGDAITLGNNTTSDAIFLDTWASNMMINETDIYTNQSNGIEELQIDTFEFYAGRQNDPVTPFVVKINGENDFTVLAVGTARLPSVYRLGHNRFPFADGAAPVIQLQPGDILATGFLDAQADGSGGGSGPVIPFDQGTDELWYTGGASGAASGRVTAGSAPMPGQQTLTDLQRSYRYDIGLTRINVLPVNQPPFVNHPGNQTHTEGDTISLAISAADPDGDPISYAATGLPAGLTINSTTGVIAGTVTTPGTYSNVTVTAQDPQNASGTTQFTWTVNGVTSNRPPSVASPGNQTHTEGATVSLGIVGNDPDGDPLTYTASGLPSSLTIDASSGVISGFLATGSAGDHQVTVTVSDGALTDSTSFQWHIAPPPTGCGGLVQEAEHGTLSGAYVIANDTNASGGQYIHVPNGTGDGRPNGPSQATYCLYVSTSGIYYLKAWVHAGSGADDSFFVRVNGNPASGYVWDTLRNTLYAMDYVSHRGGANPVELALGAGEHNIVFDLREDGTRLDKIELELFQAQVLNQPPLVAAPGNQTHTEGDSVSLSIGANDPDGDPLTYSATGLPPGLTLDNTQGMISGALAPGSAGTYPISISITDGSNPVNLALTWTVRAAPGGWLDFSEDTANRLNLTSVPATDSDEKDIAAGDLNRDGWTDIVVVRKAPFDSPGASADLLLINVNGNLQDQTQTYAPEFIANPTDARDVLIADVDGDGWQDVVIATTFNTQPVLYRNQGADTQGDWLGLQDESTRFPANWDVDVLQFCAVTAGDVNGDGKLDLYFANYDFDLGADDILFINDGTGHFIDESQARLGNRRRSAFGTAAQITDMDGDGDADIVKLSSEYGVEPWGTPGIFILYNDGSGHFYVDDQTPYTTVPSTAAYMFMAADLNQDGVQDIFVQDDGQDYVNLGSQGAVGEPPQFTRRDLTSIRTAGHGGNFQLTDLDHDGDPDLGIADVDTMLRPCQLDPENPRKLTLLRNEGDGTFIDPWGGAPKAWSENAFDFTFIDINQDGNLDLFAAHCASYAVFMNTAAPTNQPPLVNNPGAQSHREGDAISLGIGASDPDGDALTYTALGLPGNLTIDANTGIISGLLATGSAGIYQVTVTANDGTLTTSTNFPWQIAPPSSNCGGLVQEAEDGVLTGAFVIANDTNASGGQYIHVPNGTGDSKPNGSSQAAYCLHVTTPGIYYLKGWVHAGSGADDSFFVQVDGTPASGYLWDTLQNTSYDLDYVSHRGGANPVELTLGTGDHNIIFHLREDGTRLDKIELELIDDQLPDIQYVLDTLTMGAGSISRSPAQATYLPGTLVQLTAVPDTGWTFAGWSDDLSGTSNPATLLMDNEKHVVAIFVDDSGLSDACGGLVQEAEDGELFGHFVIGNDPAASNGAYIHVPNGTGDGRHDGPSRAEYCFTIATPGTYHLRGRVYGDSGHNDSFFVRVNGDPIAAYLWDTTRNTNYATDYLSDRGKANPVVLTLMYPGEQDVTVNLREDGTRLDQLELVLVEPLPATAQMSYLRSSPAPFNPTAASASDASLPLEDNDPGTAEDNDPEFSDDGVGEFADATSARLAAPSLSLTDPTRKAVASGDLNNDGWDDLVVVRRAPLDAPVTHPDVLLMNVKGVLTDHTETHAPGFVSHPTDARDVTIADLDGDGWRDVVIATDRMPIYYRNQGRNRRGAWQGLRQAQDSLPTFGTGSFCALAAGDINGNGALDLYLSGCLTEGVAQDVLLFNDGNGSFTDVSDAQLGELRQSAMGMAVQIIDMDQDGDQDIVKLSSSSSVEPWRQTGIFILYNHSKGHFTDWQAVPSLGASAFRAGDLNGDNLPDLYVAEGRQDSVQIASQITVDTHITFTRQPVSWLRRANRSGQVYLADLNRDGSLDAGIADVLSALSACPSESSNDTHLVMLLNEGDGMLNEAWPHTGQPGLADTIDVAFFDVNRDGRLDIFAATCTGYAVWLHRAVRTSQP